MFALRVQTTSHLSLHKASYKQNPAVDLYTGMPPPAAASPRKSSLPNFGVGYIWHEISNSAWDSKRPQRTHLQWLCEKHTLAITFALDPQW